INSAIKDFFKGRTYYKNDDFVRFYYDKLEKYILSGGKRFRPFLLTQTYKSIIKKDDQRIYRPSLSVEFLHNASLIHDDIIDRDEMRRGQLAFHCIFRNFYRDSKYTFADANHFGITMGILGGDSTFFLGSEALQCEFPPELNEKAHALYTRAYHEICDGVLMEMNFVQIPNVTESQYLQMISLKTGALIEKSILIGATYATAPEEIKKAFSKYAINLGIAFQIKDDVLGSFGKDIGKPTSGDIKDGKKTLLLIKALELSNQDEKKILNDHVGNENLDDDDVDAVREVFKNTGALDYCLEKIQSYSNNALIALESIEKEINAKQVDVFKAAVEFNSKRKK
ncbi:MAG: polyprenyl synthetase family protein, partial [Promethearchaeota archaeon]